VTLVIEENKHDMDYLAEYNNAMNILNTNIREVRAKLNTPQAGEIIQALRDYVNAYLDSLENNDANIRETTENTWIVLMRLADDDFDGLPEP
jgi:hypothetical protein